MNNLNNNIQEKKEDFVQETGKVIIYQILTRLFGNKKKLNKVCGTKEENGVGKFNDINDLALEKIKELGVNHIWYTGVMEHATMNDFTAYGIPLDDPDIVKGKAGSPYAIKDYYDVPPDLAVDVKNRMGEFTELVHRTHSHGMNVIIDFVPNHVARKYFSDARPSGIEDLGENDNTSLSFDPNNNFYYLPGKILVIPKVNNTLCNDPIDIDESVRLKEVPAKVTGNNVFSSEPGVYDWFETVKLNYGVDILNGEKRFFDPIPSTWKKMLDILNYWVDKGVDGFRCDMVEFVPVEFWEWVIPKVKEKKPSVLFIAEIYSHNKYHNYIHQGKFDILYDKVGLYDCLRKLMEGHGSAKDITNCWQEDSPDLSSNMLRFLENHDEQRISSVFFASNPWVAIPAMTVCATLSTGPVMIYFGQEVGEPAEGASGFSSNDGRTTIFDYWGVPEHQKWMNDGKFDGGQLSEDQKKLRHYYVTLLKLSSENEAISKGGFYGLQYVNDNNQSEGYNDSSMYSYLRFYENENLLIVVNFSKNTNPAFLKIPEGAWRAMSLEPQGKYTITDLLLTDNTISFEAENTCNHADPRSGIKLTLDPLSASIYKISKKTE